MNKRQLAKLKKENIIEYVVKHGEWRLKRGKNLSAILPMPFGIVNPQIAFQKAKEMFSGERSNKAKMAIRRQMLLTGQTPLEAMLGIPSPNEPPWPGARKVPHTCYQWY